MFYQRNFGANITGWFDQNNICCTQVTREDCIKKEVIQQLCVEPMTHSNLNKALVENVNMETGLETVIDQVAVFKKQSTQNGVSLYELKPGQYA